MTVDGATGNVGIGTTTPTAKLDVNGNQSISGDLTLPSSGAATAGGGFSSGPLSLAASSFNSGIGLPVSQTFQWQAQPVGNNTSGASGQLSLLYGSGTNVPTATGLSLASNGMVTASSFTGSGAGLTNVNAATLGGMVPSAFATVGGANTFTGNQSVTGNLSASGQLISTVATGTAPLSVSSSTVVPNLNSSFVGGLAATQLARVDVGNSFTGNQSITGNVSLSGILALPNTTSATAGVITLGSARFAHNFGTNNTFLGANAGNTSLTGTNNTGVGSFALFSNTTGGFNSAFGFGALSNNTTGFSNSAFGNGALIGNTTGSNNSAFGTQALHDNTASGNSAFGTNALNFNTTGLQNSAFGASALQANTTASNNAAFGTSALQSNTGSNNSAFGTQALQANTTGASNSAFGSFALFSNTTGNFNSAFGEGALSNNTTGFDNSTFGASALQNNTTGTRNSSFGANALNANTTGFNNSAFGDGALFRNTTGNSNAAFGTFALEFNNPTTPGQGQDNSAFGTSALQNNTTGGSNSAFGLGALINLTSGNSNIAIGTNAGVNLTSGSNNIYIGNGVASSESNTIRIGTSAIHTATFIAGINAATSAMGVAVFVNSSDQLGTLTSSRRFKHEIADLGGESDLLMKLRPVAFYYKPELDETQTRQYGLVAEEVAQVAPQLVVYDQEGAPQTVRYHFVNAMLLNEVQKQRTIIVSQESKIQDLEARLARLEATIAGQ
jgi:hypothetical protein